MIDSRGFVDLAYRRRFASGMQLMVRGYADAYRWRGFFGLDVGSLASTAIDDQVGTMAVCFAGEGGMEAALQAFFQDQNSRAPAIEVRVARGSNEMRTCNVVFLAYPDSTRTREALGHLQGTSVLTIGEGEEFVRMGGVIALAAHGNTLRLLVNPNAAQRAHLRISAKLLSMATVVTDEPGAKD